MCIISGPVVSVNSTKILCLPSKSGKRQLTVYSNAVATPDSNAMCLPCPTPQTVKFENVPKDIFKQCYSSFDISKPRGGGSRGLTLSSNRAPLTVQSHGSYDVVLVPSMADLDRVPSSFTTLTPEVIEFLNASYPVNFGIVLCRLKKGSTNYEPFAYSHDIQPNKQLFFPTKHYHSHNQTPSIDEEEGWSNGFGSSLLGGSMLDNFHNNMRKIANTRFADDWDHEIYSVGTPVWCHESREKHMRNTNAINWSQIPVDFQLGPSAVLRCKEVVGHEANVDIEMPVGAT
jgi:hypothetical protein